DLPIAAGVGELGDELNVKALIDDAKEAQPRPRELGEALIGDRWIPALPEVLDLDAAGHAVHIGIGVALAVIERRSPGEHDIGDVEQRRFTGDQWRRRALERAQLIHTVVDEGPGL